MTHAKQALGWREWLALPDIGIPLIKAKVDTGARTSCLHAFYVEPFRRDHKDFLRFGVHPMQNDAQQVLHCEAQIADQRQVSDSGGHRELRFVIRTRLQILDFDDEIELTLTNRDSMRFRMLLGRTALVAANLVVDSSASYLAGKP
ncbi:ATP-dependent zinc protease family protein [Thiosocius teredinicola]|uniref:ATP-dependent zinc protease family protein n=1 Tax=Thiosocius teredinicola TaxID=1973002 RepID=UPI000990F2C2